MSGCAEGAGPRPSPDGKRSRREQGCRQQAGVPEHGRNPKPGATHSAVCLRQILEPLSALSGRDNRRQQTCTHTPTHPRCRPGSPLRCVTYDTQRNSPFVLLLIQQFRFFFFYLFFFLFTFVQFHDMHSAFCLAFRWAFLNTGKYGMVSIEPPFVGEQ